MADSEMKLLQGNQACAEAALAAGVKFFAGYPITPSTEIAEMMAERLPLIGGKFIQMEDEIASMAAVIGASLAGFKAMTATSGPGFSLKQENIGFAAMAEVPCVIINVMRAGPSTGLPTSPAQGDVMQARWGTHGDHPIVVFCPASVEDIYTFTVKAVNISEELRIPVILLMDEIIGHMRESVKVFNAEDFKGSDRPKPNDPPGKYLPYRADDSLVPPLAEYGKGYHFHVTGLAHDESGFPTNDGDIAEKMLVRMHKKLELNSDKLVFTEQYRLFDADVAVITYGSTARSAEEAVELAREEGIQAGLLTLKTIWPFPEKEIAALAQRVKMIVVPEMNLGQIIREVERVVHGRVPVIGVNRVNGRLIEPQEIFDVIKQGDKNV